MVDLLLTNTQIFALQGVVNNIYLFGMKLCNKQNNVQSAAHYSKIIHFRTFKSDKL